MGGRESSAGVELLLLGPMRLLRDGMEMPLPASRKTRALLAYLALAGRPVRRDFLCGLLWELPDDPRGALRWSLTKLRALLDEPDAQRLTADREAVLIDAVDLAADWSLLRHAADQADSLPIADLRALARARGEFLEGLDLPRCDQFQAWLLAMREDTRRWQCTVAAALARRSDDAEEALAAARNWVELAPFDPDARVVLDNLLDRTGRQPEIGGQRALAVEKLEEAGLAVPGILRQAASLASASPGLPREQEVHFCTASDGTGLAWSRVGEGAALVKTANWLNHLEHDWESPVWRHWITALTHNRSLIRYDERGNGLSDWNSADLSLDAFVDDLASVVDAAGLDRFDLLGVSQGCSVSVAYAVRNPGRVRRLILYGGYAAGWRVRADPAETARREAMMTLMREGWGQNNPAFRQMYTTLFFPEASPVEMDWFNELQRVSTSPANAVRLSEAFADLDVRALLPLVNVPVLVVHARDDAVVPYPAGRAMARAIPGAQFVTLESRNHMLLESEPAWTRFIAAVDAFLA